jgi:hypothetical protein
MIDFKGLFRTFASTSMAAAVIGLLGFAFDASAATTKKTKKQKLEKNMSFNDRVVKGKHQVPGEGIVTIENEKPVFNLLSVRSDFSDRREKERQRD